MGKKKVSRNSIGNNEILVRLFLESYMFYKYLNENTGPWIYIYSYHVRLPFCDRRSDCLYETQEKNTVFCPFFIIDFNPRDKSLTDPDLGSRWSPDQLSFLINWRDSILKEYTLCSYFSHRQNIPTLLTLIVYTTNLNPSLWVIYHQPS